MKNYNIKNNQNGAALVVGLVLLVVVTVLAVSGMNTATTELAMARNDQSYENAFQAAETGLELALATRRYSTQAPVVVAQDITANESVAVSVNFENSTPVPDDRAFSLGTGAGVSAYHFVVNSTGSSKPAGGAGVATDRDATATHTQAFYIIGPETPAF